jgi:hypothetical protein
MRIRKNTHNVNVLWSKPQYYNHHKVTKYLVNPMFNKIENKKYALNDNEKCPICYDEISHNEIIAKIRKCRHFFHKPCLDQWLNVKKICPMCRYKL